MKLRYVTLTSGERVVRVIADDFIMDVTEDDSMIPISGPSPEQLTKRVRLGILTEVANFRLSRTDF